MSCPKKCGSGDVCVQTAVSHECTRICSQESPTDCVCGEDYVGLGQYCSSQQVKECHESCATCTGPLATDCLSCHENWVYISYLRKCVKKIENCLEYNYSGGFCVSCAGNYAPPQCIACSPRCNTCAVPGDASRCYQCADGYIAASATHSDREKRCVARIAHCVNHSQFEPFCLQCEDSYQLNDDLTACIQSNCAEFSGGQCTRCKSGHQLVEGVCWQVQLCGDFYGCRYCLTGEKVCVQPYDNFVYNDDDSKYHYKDENCREFSGGLCTQCKERYSVSKTGELCIANEENCLVYNNSGCEICMADSFVVQQGFLTVKCQKCALLLPQCEQCQKDICFKSQTGNIGDICIDGWVIVDSFCQKCDEQCKTCNESVGYCTSCNGSKLQPYRGKCTILTRRRNYTAAIAVPIAVILPLIIILVIYGIKKKKSVH